MSSQDYIPGTINVPKLQRPKGAIAYNAKGEVLLHAFTCTFVADDGKDWTVQFSLNETVRGSKGPVTDKMKSKDLTNREWYSRMLKNLLDIPHDAPLVVEALDGLRCRLQLDTKGEPQGLYISSFQEVAEDENIVL